MKFLYEIIKTAISQTIAIANIICHFRTVSSVLMSINNSDPCNKCLFVIIRPNNNTSNEHTNSTLLNKGLKDDLSYKIQYSQSS